MKWGSVSDWFALAVGVLLAVFLAREWWRRRQWRLEAQEASRAQVAHAKLHPLTTVQREALREWLATRPRLPALVLTVDTHAPIAAGGTRLGGPVWLPDGEQWPIDQNGHPLEFVAQLDFGAMPPLPDYPDAGLLQWFVGRDDMFGANLEKPEQGNFRLIWHPGGAVGSRCAPPPPLKGKHERFNTPFEDAKVRETGIALTAAREDLATTPWDDGLHEFLLSIGVGNGDSHAEVEAMVDALPETQQRHHVGGHPAFTQFDFRQPGGMPPHNVNVPSPYADADRVLFQLTSADGLLWGDAGEANVLIRRADLLARQFDRAIFWWDCH